MSNCKLPRAGNPAGWREAGLHKSQPGAAGIQVERGLSQAAAVAAANRLGELSGRLWVRPRAADWDSPRSENLRDLRKFSGTVIQPGTAGTEAECARPRAQQRGTAGGLEHHPRRSIIPESLRPRTGALRGHRKKLRSLRAN